MAMKTRGKLLGAVALVLGMSGQALFAQSLADTMIAAYRTSGLLDQNRAVLRAADEDVAQAVSTLRPVLNYIGEVSTSDTEFLGRDESASVGLNATLLLSDFGRTRLTIDGLKETVLATRQGLIDVEQQVLLRAVAAFLNVRRQGAFVSLQDNNVRVITEQLRAAQDRFEVGEITRTDVSIAEARLAAARSAKAAADGALAQAREEYRAVTTSYPGNLTSPGTTPATANTLAAATSVARDRHPSIKQAQHQVTAAELGVMAAQASLRPTFTGSANFGIDDDGDTTDSLALQLTGPIYQGGQIASVIRAAQASRDSARAGLFTTMQAVDQEVGNAWADVMVARATESASEEEVQAAQLALRGAQEELQVGSRTTLDVLDLEQELLDAQTNLISVQIDLVLANYSLLSAMGLLTVQHLGLGIAEYDPSAYYKAVSDAPTVLVSPQGERLDRVLKSLGRE